MHSFLTFIIPTSQDIRLEVEKALDDLGNPADKFRDAFRRTLIVHFMSSSLVHGEGKEKDSLVIETSVDGTAKDAVLLFDDEKTGLSQLFDPLFKLIGAPQTGKSKFLLSHMISTGQGLFNIPGLNFAGAPGMSVKRIREEHNFSRRIRDYFDDERPSGSALKILHDVREAVYEDDFFKVRKTSGGKIVPYDFTPMHKIESTDLLGSEGEIPYFRSALKGILNFFWPVLLVSFLISAVMSDWETLISGHENFLKEICSLVVHWVLISLVLIIVSAGVIYSLLRSNEKAEMGDEAIPEEKTLTETREKENSDYLQNHLFGVSRIKPGLVRKITLRLAFFVIGIAATNLFRPGYLGQIGTIHFARWFVIPGTNKLIFCSNYGGSWESYLEDFINKASYGLTAVWSNCFDYPPAENLFFKGSENGEAFKRWARRQQIPTRFWYCAYPHLTTDRIRINAAIRKGLFSASTEDEAEAFLSLFGGMKRPEGYIERDEIQTLMFGGLGRHEQSAFIFMKLPEDTKKAKVWLKAQDKYLSFGSAPSPERVDQIAFSASGFAKLDLPKHTRDEFSYPFARGMAHPERKRVLFDTGEDHPDNWSWGNDQNRVDCAHLIYVAGDASEDENKRRKNLEKKLKAIVASHLKELNKSGGDHVYTLFTKDLIEREPTFTKLDTADTKNSAKNIGKAEERNRGLPREAFGFVDGVSQPIIRGMKRGQPKKGSELHMVEPGEFLLGYPDNRGTRVYVPRVPASKDPDNILPVHMPDQGDARFPDFGKSGVNQARSFGRNGTYLVIRQLQQHVDKFEKSMDVAAKQAKGHKGIPDWYTDDQRREFMAAKMVGRWKDGTSLVKYPFEPGTGWYPEKNDKPLPLPDNDFLFGEEDPSGTSCPFGSHIRRSNPRDSFPPHDQSQLDIVNRHRILRRGRFYKQSSSSGNEEGLLFICANADIERQFEFIQQTWCFARQFMGTENEVDPILGRGEKMGRVTIPTASGPIFVSGMKDMVQVRGGEYFFLPSKSAIRYLCHSI